MESIEIGDNCFKSVQTFQMDGLHHLKSLKIGKNSFTQNKNGDDKSKSFHILNCESLESIEIGNECFAFVKTFQIDGLYHLKSLKIGKNSFTQEKNDWGNDKSKSFHILNCGSLESIEIGEYSFNDFAGQFELKNLPALQSIQIDLYNFYYSSFVIRGILNDIEYVMNRSS